jgi:hypothetical protein
LNQPLQEVSGAIRNAPFVLALQPERSFSMPYSSVCKLVLVGALISPVSALAQGGGGGGGVEVEVEVEAPPEEVRRAALQELRAQGVPARAMPQPGRQERLATALVAQREAA